ncbi:class I SAM-dependent methyltransferase [Novosphingobium sp.]|uniref:class I SAM-dependent methyltransferase n=1 Tax=Novosphingobium sp. TaxID=1874826 RepID=UPI0025F74E34|nr:class I SAM-dependent methyltransferase [Novosphingobium sp.]
MAERPADVLLPRSAGRSAFGSDAAGYQAGRIGYPEPLFDLVFADVPANPRVLEIGAGTGIATRSLLERAPAELVVVEPDAALIDYIADQITDPRLTLVNAPFPEESLEGPFDLIVCAAAFHWMEPAAALARVSQLLKPGGVWAMWWNAYRNPGHGDTLAQAISPLIEGIALPPSEGPDGHYSLNRALHEEALRNAGFVDIRHTLFRRERRLDATEARALYASYSYVRALPQDQRNTLLDAIAHLVEHDFAGSAPNVVLSALYTARRVP